jgi:hypothetical protein
MPRNTVGIETAPAEILCKAGFTTFNPARAVVERHPGGMFAKIVVAATPLVGDVDLEAAAKVYADFHAFTLVPEVFPLCGWCGRATNVCADPFGHGRLSAGRDARLLTPADADDSLTMRWAA